MIRAGAALWLAAGVAYLGLEALAASAYPGYRYAGDVISTLGTPDSPLRWAMNTAFVVQGMLFCVGALLLTTGRGPHKSILLVVVASANAVGNVVVATVPSGAPGLSWLHVAGAGLAVVGGNAAILVGARFVCAAPWYRAVSALLGGAGLVGLTVFAATGSAAAERLSVYTIIGWQLLSALVMLSAAGLPSCFRRGRRRTRTDPTESPAQG